jgi:hypothetical protein
MISLPGRASRHIIGTRPQLTDRVEHPVGGGGEQLPDQAAVGQEQHPVGVRCGAWIVRDHHHGLVILVNRPADLGEQLGRGPGVEVSGRLVGEDQVGPGDQRPSRGHPLLLAAGQLGRAVFQAVGDAQRAGEFIQPPPLGLLAAQGEREDHVLLRGQGRDKVEGLEDEPDAIAAEQGHRPVVKRAEVDLADQHASGGEPVQAGQAVQQGGLARAGRPHDRGELADGELRGDRVECPDSRHALAVDLHAVHDARRRGRLEHRG